MLAAAAVLVVLAVLLSADLSGRPGAAAQESPGTTDGTDLVAAGQALYTQSCASCHGPAGQGGPNGPTVVGVGIASWDFYLRTGRMPLAAPGAPAYRQEPAFDENGIQALEAYGRTLGAGEPEIPNPQVSEEAQHRGWQLYLNNCAACHGTSGAGGSVGGGNLAPGLGRADPVTTVEAMLIGPGVMPVFVLPDEDLSAVASYVQYLRQAPSPGGVSLGGAGPVPEGFISGVLGLGAIVLIARWVARNRDPGHAEAGRGTLDDPRRDPRP
jgi:ubiquinol-cytochrome c reductase cytochrome c subunit